jgi:hypothetical protein
MSQQWHYARHGQTYGPYTPEQLRDLAEAGRLLPDDLVTREGASKWVPARSVPGLFPDQAAARSAPPPPRADAPREAIASRPVPLKPVPLTPVAAEEKPPSTLVAALLGLPKPLLFGLCGGIGGLLGALLLGELLWLLLSPSGLAAPPLQIAVPPAVRVYAGGRNRFLIKVERTGFKGPVKVEVAPIEHVNVPPIEIPADKKEGEVEVQASDRSPLWQSKLEIKATALTDKPIAPVTASMDLSVEVMPPTLAVVASPRVPVDQGGKGRFTVRVGRARFDGDVLVRFSGLPAGVFIRDHLIKKGATDATVDVTVPPTCPVADTPVTVEASSQLDGTRVARTGKFVLAVQRRPPPTVDVVFVLDLTGSMQFAINGIKQGIQSFVEGLERERLDARIGVICFRDIDPPPAGDNERPYALMFPQPDGGTGSFTKDYRAVRDKVAPLIAGGGGDEPESSLQAMVLAAEQPFRPKASRVLVLITDAPPKIHARERIATVPQTVEELKKREIDQVHLVIRQRELNGEFRPFKNDFAGEWFNLENATRGDAFAGLLPSLSKAISRITVAARPKASTNLEPPPLPEAGSASFAPPPDVPVLKAVQSTQAFAAKDRFRLLLAIVAWTMVVAGAISLFIVAGQQLHARQAFVDLSAAARAVGGGLLAGLLGGAVGQLVFQSIARGGLAVESISRVLGWSLLGGLIGVIMAFFVPNLKSLRGMAGGLMGGVLGAMAFVILSLVLGQLLGRWMGAAILGFFIGLMVALAELAFRRWWLEIAVSAREVRTVTLGTAPVTIGGDERRVTFYVQGAPPVALRYSIDEDRVLCEDETTGEVTEIEPGDHRTLGRVGITMRSYGTSKKTGYVLSLSNGRDLILQEGMPLTAEDLPGLQARGTDGIVALVSRHPTQPKQVTLRNRSQQPWSVRFYDGRTQVVEPGRGIDLDDQIQLNFGQVQGIIEIEQAARR